MITKDKMPYIQIFPPRSRGYQVFKKCRTRRGDGCKVSGQTRLTTANREVFSAQMTNLVAVVVAVVKSKALY